VRAQPPHPVEARSPVLPSARSYHIRHTPRLRGGQGCQPMRNRSP
jgi:hypothetical protein